MAEPDGGALTNLGRFGEAEEHFERAIELEPANPIYAVNLASLRLSSPESAIVSSARQELNELSASKPAGRLALEALIREALHSGDFENARMYASKLEARPDQSWDDKLLELDTAFQTPGFRNRLANLQRESVADLGNRVALVYWMIGHGIAKDVTDWLNAGGKSTPVPLQMALADAFRAQQNWPRLREMLEPADWAANDFIRKALLALCERNEPTFQNRWQVALQSVQAGKEISSWGTSFLLGLVR